MRKLLLLGGAAHQIPAICCAKEAGYFTVLCDYLHDNPGQHYADRFYCVSTTDFDAVLEVARQEKIDGIVAFASDPAAATAAYVSEKLRLPSNPYAAVKVLSEKNLFKDYLSEHGFHTPMHIGFEELDAGGMAEIRKMHFPVMVKPDDSSGSKGITKVEAPEAVPQAVAFAKQFSRSGRIVVEEFICKDHPYMVGGDIFVVDGEVVFWGLLNCHRDAKVNPLVPVGKSYPLELSQPRYALIKREISRLLHSLDIRFGAFNVELMITADDRLFFIEMGPRNGGNMIPDLLSMISGKNMVMATVRAAMGETEMDIAFEQNGKFVATHNLHSRENGVFKEIAFSAELEQYIVSKKIYKKAGAPVEFFDSANKVLGIIFMEFDSKQAMQKILADIENRYTVVLA